MSWFGGWFGPESGGVPSAVVGGERAPRTATLGLTPRLLIERARDRHPLFDPKSHPDGVLLRALSGEERRLVGKALEVNPSSIAASLTIDVNSYSFADGQLLPAFHHVESADAIPTDPTALAFPLIRVAWPNRAYLGAVQAYSIQSHSFYLSGARADWTGIDVVLVTYAPIPVDLTTLDDFLVVPDTAEAALVSFLAHFMARRVPVSQMPIEDLAGFASERAAAERDFLSEMEKVP